MRRFLPPASLSTVCFQFFRPRSGGCAKMVKGEVRYITLLVLLCVCNYATVVGSTVPSDNNSGEDVLKSCAAVKPIFEAKNISADIPDTPVNGLDLSVCASELSCCTRDMEAALQRQVRRDFQALLQHNSRSLEGLLVSAANTIRDHVLELLRQSENKTASLFEQQYRRISRQAREPVSALYATLGGHLDVPLQPSATGVTGAAAAPDLEEAVTGMFAGLFPLVYRHAVSSRARDFAADYRACLREVTPELQPFGDAPRQLARSVQRALEAARVLRQALLLGARVLNATDSLLTGEHGPPGGAAAQAQCHAALLRMSYCSRCHGLQRRVRPCAGLCLNVLRGCLTQHAAELDLPWNGYVEAAERLVVAVQGHGAIDDVLRSLDGRITEAIMIAMEPAPNLEDKVKRSCGPHKWDESSPASSEGEEEEEEAAAGEEGPRQLASGQSEVLGVTLTQGHITTGSSQDTLSSKLQHFLTSLTRSRGFYANLAESLCSDESFAETRDTADCWNGQRVGEYTKTVVASSVTAQKYNPELTWAPYNPDARIAELSDKLRHIKQVVVSQLTETPPALSYTHYEEGSGSGQEPGGGWDAEQDGGWRDDGSGSGDIPIVGGGAGGVDTSSTDNAVHVSPGEGRDEKKAGSGTGTVLSCSLLLIVFGATAATSYLYDG